MPEHLASARISTVTLNLKATVRGERLIFDELIDLPEGSEIDLVPADEGDSWEAAQRRAVRARWLGNTGQPRVVSATTPR